MTQSLLNRLNDIENLLNSVKSELQTAPKPAQRDNKPPFSFEFFPAKTDEAQNKLFEVFQTLATLNPKYCSVTYGAGGSTRERTLGIVKSFREKSDVPVVPHMSCIGDSKREIGELLDYYKDLGVKRVVALRGDLPSGQVGYGELPFALDLVK